MTPHSSPSSDGDSPPDENTDTAPMPFWGWAGLPIAALLAVLYLPVAAIKAIARWITRR